MSSSHARYAAFISYSRTADTELAPALQQALQRFAKPWNKLRAVRVFRDDANMSANPDLWFNIQRALDEAEYFILLASPEAAASPWVGKEIEYWVANKPLDHLLICLTDGTIAWAGNDFDRERSTSVPPALHGAFSNEPRWVDLSALRPADLSLQVPAFREKVADLAAPLHHLDKDELFGEDVRQFRRTRRLVRATIAGLAALSLIAAGAAVVAFQQRRNAEASAVEARRQRDVAVANQMAAEAQRLLAVDQTLAAQLNALAYRLHPSPSTLGRLVGGNARALSRQVINPPRQNIFRSRVSYSQRRQVMAVVIDFFTAGVTRTRRVELWDLSHPERPKAVAPQVTADLNDVQAAAFSDDGRRLAVAGADTGVQLWDISSVDHPVKLGEQVPSPGAEDVALSPDGEILATRLTNDEVSIWQVTDPTRTVMLGRVPESLPEDLPGALSFNPAGTVLASSTQNGTTRLWPLANAFAAPPRATIIGTQHADFFNVDAAIGFSPDSTVIAVGGTNSEIQLWKVADLAHPVIQGPPLAGHTASVSHIAFAADGRTMASASADRTVRLWDVSDPTNGVPLGAALTGHADDVDLVVFGADKGVLLSHGVDATVRLWQLPTARARIDDHVRALEFSQDGTELLAGDDNGVVHRWPTVANPDLARGTTHRPAGEADPQSTVTSIRLADGQLAAVDDDQRLWIWGRDALGTTKDPRSGQLWASAFSPDGKTIAFSPLDGADQLYLSTAGMSRPVGVGYPARRQYDHVTAIAFRSDGRLIAAGDGAGNVRIWNVADPNHPAPVGQPLTGHTDGVTDVAFAPDGRSVVSTAYDRTIRIWRLSADGVGSAGATITDLDDYASSIAFAPDGTMFATAGKEGSIRLWDAAQSAAAGPPIVAQDDKVALIRWSRNGSQLAVAGEQSIGLLDLSPDRAIARICATTSWISPEQWKTRVSPELPYANVCT